ncbi:MAG: hypothetical protein QXO75_10625 [Nitrososphaerota archaeon]
MQACRAGLQKKLSDELERLKAKLGYGKELSVKWVPHQDKFLNSGNNKLSGEVVGKTIYIYEDDEKEALETLRHEFLDYMVSIEVIAPYKKFINNLIRLFEEEVYKRKEVLIENLRELV